MKKSLTRLLVAILFVFSISLLVTNATQAKPKLNKITKVMIKGNKYTLKIKGVKNRNLKAVTFKTSKKSVVKVKKTSKKTAVITARKTGKATIKVTITYKKRNKGKKKFTLKCKVTVQSIKKKESTGTNGTDVLKNTNTNSVDWTEDVIDKLLEQIDASEEKGNIYKINDYTIYCNRDSYQYGFITSPFWSDIDWYNEKEYRKIMIELKKIVEDTHISDEMTAQEKAYRLGRYLAKYINYYLPTHEQTIYGTLFNKQSVCGGYSHTYATLCRYVGLECDYVASDEILNHAWNIIKLGDYWYSVDITAAHGLRNYKEITIEFFREWDYVGEKAWSHLREKYRTSEYRSTHPIDTMSYNMRCKQEGIPYLTGEELYKLPE